MLFLAGLSNRTVQTEGRVATQEEGQPFGKYQLLQRIATGGMAEIYRARSQGAAGVTKPVVIKKILPAYASNKGFVTMFINEAKIAMGLSHGNIAQVFDFGEVNGEYFISMEWVNGQTLSKVMRRAQDIGIPYLPVSFALMIAMEISKGLQYAHTQLDEKGRPLNIIHRDISPQNIILSYEGQVKIVDFGIARATNIERQTQTGLVKGKYFYFAPEQARGKELDARIDIFSAGIVMYEMLCGRRPFEGKMLDVMAKIVRGEFPRPRALNPAIPENVEKIILTALATDRTQRYATAQLLYDALAGHLYTEEKTFSADSLSRLMMYLFQRELSVEGRAVILPPEFIQQLHLSGTVVRPKSFQDKVQERLFKSPGKAFFIAIPLFAALLSATLVYLIGSLENFSIRLSSEPAGATVLIDGRAAPSPTPLLISDLAVHERHHLELRAPGKKTWAQDIEQPNAPTVSIHARLEEERP